MANGSTPLSFCGCSYIDLDNEIILLYFRIKIWMVQMTTVQLTKNVTHNLLILLIIEDLGKTPGKMRVASMQIMMLKGLFL